MFGKKYGLKQMTLEKPLIGRFRLPRVRPGGKAPNRELPPKSGDITCMPGFDTGSGNILSFLLPLIQERHLSVTSESMCMKYWLTV